MHEIILLLNFYTINRSSPCRTSITASQSRRADQKKNARHIKPGCRLWFWPCGSQRKSSYSFGSITGQQTAQWWRDSRWCNLLINGHLHDATVAWNNNIYVMRPDCVNVNGQLVTETGPTNSNRNIGYKNHTELLQWHVVINFT